MCYTTLHFLRRSKSICTTLHYERRRKNCTTMHEKKKHYYIALHYNTQGKNNLLHCNALQLHRITTQKVVWALRICFSKIIREKSNESLWEGTQDLKDRREMEWEFMKRHIQYLRKESSHKKRKKRLLRHLNFQCTIMNGDVSFMMRSQLLEGLKCESQIENNRRTRSRGTFPGL